MKHTLNIKIMSNILTKKQKIIYEESIFFFKFQFGTGNGILIRAIIFREPIKIRGLKTKSRNNGQNSKTRFFILREVAKEVFKTKSSMLKVRAEQA